MLLCGGETPCSRDRFPDRGLFPGPGSSRPRTEARAATRNFGHPVDFGKLGRRTNAGMSDHAPGQMEAAMRYMMLIYTKEGDRDKMSPEEAQQIRDRHAAVMNESRERGMLVAVNGLGRTHTATTVRVEARQSPGHRRAVRRNERATRRILRARLRKHRRSDPVGRANSDLVRRRAGVDRDSRTRRISARARNRS